MTISTNQRRAGMRDCEIIYVQDPKGWKWRAIGAENARNGETDLKRPLQR